MHKFTMPSHYRRSNFIGNNAQCIYLVPHKDMYVACIFVILNHIRSISIKQLLGFIVSLCLQRCSNYGIYFCVHPSSVPTKCLAAYLHITQSFFQDIPMFQRSVSAKQVPYKAIFTAAATLDCLPLDHQARQSYLSLDSIRTGMRYIMSTTLC